MATDIIFFIILSLTLGFKHAYDADHLVAVSNFLARSTTTGETLNMTVSWGIGHMLTASIITILLFTLARTTGISTILMHFESLVGFMLILIGGGAIIFELLVVKGHIKKKYPAEPDRNDKKAHHHLHPQLFGVGIVHGLASNDELLALFVASLGIGSLALLLVGLTLFTVGVILGMIVFGACITYPLLRHNGEKLRITIVVGSGLFSIVYGIMVLHGMSGFNVIGLLA